MLFRSRGDGKVTAVGRERAGRIDEPQALEIAVERGLDEPPLHAAGLGVGEVEVHEEGIALAEVGDVAPVGAQRRGEVERAVRALLGEDWLRDAPGFVMLGELRQIGRLDGVSPLVEEVVERDAERPLDGALEDRKSTRLNSSHGYISY